jgi:hypothetical protein
MITIIILNINKQLFVYVSFDSLFVLFVVELVSVVDPHFKHFVSVVLNVYV